MAGTDDPTVGKALGNLGPSGKPPRPGEKPQPQQSLGEQPNLGGNEGNDVSGLGLATRGFTNTLGSTTNTPNVGRELAQLVAEQFGEELPEDATSQVPSLSTGIGNAITGDRVQRALESVGVPVEDESTKPQNPGQRAALRAGQAVGAVPGFILGGRGAGTIAKGLPSVAGRAGRFIDDAAKSLQRNPASGTALEAGSAAAGGAAGGVADRLTDSPAIIAAAEIGAGVAAPGNLAVRAGNKVANRVRSAAQREQGNEAFRRAASTVQQNTENPQQAIGDVRGRPQGVNPVTATGDTELTNIQQAAASRSNRLDELQNIRQRSEEFVKSEALADFGQGAGREDAGQQVSQFLETLDQARRQAQQRLINVAQGRNPEFTDLDAEEVGNQTAKFLRQQERAAAQAESQLFNRIPEQVSVGTLPNTRDAIQQLRDEIESTSFPTTSVPNEGRRLQEQVEGQSSQDEILNFVDDIVNSTNKTGTTGSTRDITANEALQFRKRLNQLRRQTSDRNRHRILNEIDQALLTDLSEESGSAVNAEVGQRIREAAEFSRVLNQTFRDGEVGRIISGVTQPSNVLRRTVGGQTTPVERLDETFSALNFEDTAAANTTTGQELEIANELGNAPPEIKEGVRNFVRQRFISSIASRDANGEVADVNLQRAQNFLRNNQRVVQRLGLEDEFGEIVTTGQGVENIEKLVSETRREGKDPLIRAANNFLNTNIQGKPADIGGRFDQVLKSNDPGRQTQQLARITSQDQTGTALRGLKSGFVGEILDRARLEQRRNRNATRALQDRSVQQVAQNLFTPDEMQRLRRFTQFLGRSVAAQGRTQRNTEEIVPPRVGRQGARFGRILGARAASRVAKGVENATGGGGGGAGVKLQQAQQGAGFTAEKLRELGSDEAERIIREAVLDDQTGRRLEQLLSANVDNPQEAEEVRQFIGLFTLPTAQDLAQGDLNKQESQQERPAALNAQQPVGTARQ